MRMINNCLKFLIIFSLISGFISFARAEEKIVAVVNNEIITQRDLEAFLNFMRIQLSKEYSAKELDEKIAVMKSDLLDRLIEDRLILQEARRNNLKADEGRIKAKIDELKKRYDSPTDFENSLKNQGLVESDLEARVRDQILMYNIVEVKIRDKIVIKPAEITEYYNKNTSEFNLSEERDFHSLAGADESDARKAVESLKQGKDMKTVAKETAFSLNAFSARKNGELKKDVEDVLFSLNSGEVSDPIKIKDSYYVFQLFKIKPAHQQALSEVQEAIHATLYEKKMQEAMTKWVEELKKKAYLKKI
ncbi:MAG: peptidyl-prolyl cis-trans isomerase [Candidatus Omnitrophica bacterium]|nr:peptidyl-prolyl cis-trans isomerase [Candidatus Omnitrophota bacterium]